MALLHSLHIIFIGRNNPSGSYLQCIPTNRCSTAPRRATWCLSSPICQWWWSPEMLRLVNDPPKLAHAAMNCAACPESIYLTNPTKKRNQARFDPCLMNILSEHGKSCRSHSDRWCFKRFFVKCSEEFRWPMSWYLKIKPLKTDE